MAKPSIITGLDIGTNTIKVLAASWGSGKGGLQILSQTEVESAGMRKGVVIKPEETCLKIKEAMNFCQQGKDFKIRQVFLNINGSHLIFLPSRGLVSVSRADQRISEADIERAMAASRAISLSANQQILDTISQEFVIDGQPGIKEALGLRGIRLEAKTLCAAVFTPYLKNLENAVLGAGLEIENISPSILACSQAVLSGKEKEAGVAIIDIGAGNTGLAVFEEGILIHAAIFPLGSNNITNDIAVVLKIEIENAERIKREFSGRARESKKDKKGKLGFPPKIVSRVIEARTREILNQAAKELKKIDKTKLPSGAVICGGGAKLFKIIDLAKQELKLPCRIGMPQGFALEIEDPAWATAAGLVLEAAGDFGEKPSFSFFGNGILKKIKRVFKTFLP